MHRCFVDFQIYENKEILVSGDEGKHMSRVMRFKPGDSVEVCDGSGYTYPGTITVVTKNDVTVKVGQAVKDDSEPATKVMLFAGLSKGAKMELVIQKSVELGITAVVPVETEFAVAKEGKPERWQRIAFEAAKQCKRPTVPKIYDAVSFDEALKMLQDCDAGICAYEKERTVGITEVLNTVQPGGTCGIFVGPEGGFSEKEIEKLSDGGISVVSLGKRILRTETAAIVMLTVVMHCFGELD
ncbi:MAG: 16S rRNA (uracil(1498)-N(3))-methyltransferase [Clostridia bacterium]|nr:16S rRNA (uracil(1498)-N(3))-methyltransferase [Clostridia bacterium]